MIRDAQAVHDAGDVKQGQFDFLNAAAAPMMQRLYGQMRPDDVPKTPEFREYVKIMNEHREARQPWTSDQLENARARLEML